MNYYNEHDPKAAAWLRELIAQGHLPPGHVDTRDIQRVLPADLVGYTQCHFFAGIGGWAHALQLSGIPTTTPLWTGSCPCQPFSVAGKGLGKADPRHLWPHFRRLIRLCRPPVVLGEQVASAAGRIWLSGVCADLEALAYRTAAADLCAAGGRPDCTLGILRGDHATGTLTHEPGTLSAPHIRQRLWWCAGRLADPHSPRLDRAQSLPEGHPRDEARLQMPRAGCPASDTPLRLGHPESRGCGELRHAPQPGSGGHPQRPSRPGPPDASGGLGHPPSHHQCRPGESRPLDGRLPLGNHHGEHERLLSPTDGQHVRLADPHRGQCGRLPAGQGCQPDGPPPGRQQSHRQPQSDCPACGDSPNMDPCGSSGSRIEGADRGLGGLGGPDHPHRGESEESTHGLGHTPLPESPRLGPLSQQLPGQTTSGTPSGPTTANHCQRERSDPSATATSPSPWTSFDLIPCRDAKTRRIESGTFPLVDGLPGRVGLLRGYGNAIVPQTAAHFIQAALQALEEGSAAPPQIINHKS